MASKTRKRSFTTDTLHFELEPSDWRRHAEEGWEKNAAGNVARYVVRNAARKVAKHVVRSVVTSVARGVL